jgi:phospholipase C
MTTSRAARDVLALLGILAGVASAPLHGAIVPTTPIRHLIVIVGENRSFDNLYGGYRPTPGESVMNLLSEGIIKADGTPGPNFAIPVIIIWSTITAPPMARTARRWM